MHTLAEYQDQQLEDRLLLQEVRHTDPLLAPTWRWDRVLELVDGKPRPKRCSVYDDEPIRQARQFMLKYRTWSEDRKIRLYRDYPGLYHAYRIYQNSERAIHNNLEAHILAARPQAEIADRMKTSVATIAAYEQLFFDVRNRLSHKDWIISQVFANAALNRTGSKYSSDDPKDDLTVKLFGYYGGPLVLDFILSGFRPVSKPLGLEDLEQWLDGHITGGLRRKTAMIAHSFPVNRYNTMALFSLHAELTSRPDASEGRATNTIERSIQTIFNLAPFCVGHKDELREAGKKRAQMQQMEGLGAELSAIEKQRVLAGMPLPEIGPPPRLVVS